MEQNMRYRFVHLFSLTLNSQYYFYLPWLKCHHWLTMNKARNSMAENVKCKNNINMSSIPYS
ncbi:hypothetical protein BX070DRAFT_224278 [Coemansia spiralis]|nr:hypothetical protein BX070DRAFT_224278 [Coemansia spiralis]